MFVELYSHTGGIMPIVEIHIKNNEIEKIEGSGTHVIIHDHDMKHITKMEFKEQVYENNKNTRYTVDEVNISNTKKE